MKLILPVICLLGIGLLLGGCVAAGKHQPTVRTLSLSAYAGEWHEIGRLPNRFERDLVAAKAIYRPNNDGTIHVRNIGLKQDGSRTSIEGTAVIPDPEEPGKLVVRFHEFPANVFAGDYWILDVNEDYTRALIGSPDLGYLWLLSKNPSDDRLNFAPQIEKARELGYETGRIIFNPERIN
jgi:apolipoprotein D and lipocalin family protein